MTKSAKVFFDIAINAKPGTPSFLLLSSTTRNFLYFMSSTMISISHFRFRVFQAQEQITKFTLSFLSLWLTL